MELCSKTMLHGYGKYHLINYFDNEIILNATSKGFQTLAIYQDKFFEELNFSTLFFGSSRPDYITIQFLEQQIS